MNVIVIKPLPDYELIDCGNFEKFERFGEFYLIRPEPQAIWAATLDRKEWGIKANATFSRNKEVKYAEGETAEAGKWSLKKGMPEQWQIRYEYKSMKLKFRLGLTSFKHVGIFPEQSDNWNFIFDSLKNITSEPKKVLNLFAYTGGASLAAKYAGADVTHVDSVKQVITWSRQNMELSNLDNIRWVVEDAMKFVKKEITRGNKYEGIILDPPAYGRGANGETWKLERDINQLIKLCSQLLQVKNSFFVANLYSLGLSFLALENLVTQHFGKSNTYQSGELCVEDNFGKKLPLGTFLRFQR
jgi:23S rRNA (cytosine1962-C5)-methyltransferase